MRSFRASSIGGKILLRSVAVALLPLAILAGAVLSGVSQLNNEAGRLVDSSREDLASTNVLVNAESQARAVRDEINLVLLERIDDARAWARNQAVIDGAKAADQFATEEGLTGLGDAALQSRFSSGTTRQASDAQRFLNQELQSNPSFRGALFTDTNGLTAASAGAPDDLVQSDEEWWVEANTEQVFVGDVTVGDDGTFLIDVAVRLDDPITSTNHGVMLARLDAGFVQEIIERRATEDIDYIVALSNGQLLGETEVGDGSLLMAESSSMTNEGLESALNGTDAGALVGQSEVYGYVRTLDPIYFSRRVAAFAGFDWVVVSEQSQESAFAPLAGVEDLQQNIGDAGGNLRTIVIIVSIVGLGLAVGMARYMARDITDPIRKLNNAVSRAATTEIPQAVNQINDDGKDLSAIEVPDIRISSGDELEDLAQSFNSVQRTAVELAASQAASRRNTAEMFVNLGRRNQSLLKRQLRFIDDLERNEADPDTLESLFRLDHLATRMRRNAESLLVMAGDRTQRRWAAPVEIRDGLQAALAEVEGYERVEFVAIDDALVQGNVVADIAHILAELIENALNFSPPQSSVTVAGRRQGDAYSILVTDAGLGMKPDELALANENLSKVQALADVPAQRLGHFVVAQLAERHNVTVVLSSAASGGLVARIDLPGTIIVAEEEPVEEKSDVVDLDGIEASVETDVEVVDQPSPAVESVPESEVPAPANDDSPTHPNRRASDKPGSSTPAPTGESESVDVGEFSFPRRRSAGEAEPPGPNPGRRADDKKAPQQQPSAPQPSAKSPGDGPSPAGQPPPAPPVNSPGSTAPPVKAPGSAAPPVKAPSSAAPGVTVPGSAAPGVTVPGSTAPGVTASGAATAGSTANAGAGPQAGAAGEGGPDLSAYGFTRRESRRSDDSKEAATGTPSTKSTATASPSVPESDEEAALTAETSRNRWSRFQRGKEDAQSSDDRTAG